MAKKRTRKPVPLKFAGVTRFIVEQVPAIRTLQLVKTIYFLEYEYLKHLGENLTEVPIIRIDMGPVPANYARLFERLEQDEVIIVERKGGAVGSQRFFPNPKTGCAFDFTSLELDVIAPRVRWVKQLVYARPLDATRAIKEESYRTEPMKRFVEQEERDGKKRIGGYVLKAPYFTERDIDPLAAYRRAYRDHLRTVAKYSVEDALEDAKVYSDLRPFLDATNTHAAAD